MREYIERDAAIHTAEKYGLRNGSALGRHSGVADRVAAELEGLPAADVAPVVHGRWEVKCESHRCDHTGEYDEDYYLECSVCHRKVWDVSQDALIMGDIEKATKDFPFCHCGARMDGGTDYECNTICQADGSVRRVP